MGLSDTYHVERISGAVGKAFVKEHHYSHGSHNGPMCWGLYRDDVLAGVCAFATPCSEAVRSSIFGAEHKAHVTELHRLVLLDEEPKNSESWFVARALKGLKQEKPHLWGVVSFADATEGHVGTIYQALNALYYGTSGRARFYVDQGGRLRHPRQNGVNISQEVAKQWGWTPTMREGKHRYLFLLPDNRAHKRDLLNELQVTCLPYPKQDVVTEMAA